MSDNDLDERFKALVEQIDRQERRKMKKAAQREWAHLPRYRRRRRWRITAAVAAVAVAGAGAFVAWRPEILGQAGTALTSALADAAPDARPTGVDRASGPVPEETTPVETEPVAVSPFEGSPAMEYADGEKGLTMPRPKATGGLSEKEVATVLGRTKALLKATHLDRRVLLKSGFKPFARLLEPSDRVWFLKNLDPKKTKKNKKDYYSSRYMLTSFAPKTTELVTDVIKVHGKTAFSPSRENGRSGVRIKVNYLFVYAVRRPGQPETAMRVVAHSKGELFAYRENGRPAIRLRQWNNGGVSGVRCDIDDGFVRPFYDDSPPDEEVVKATGAPVDPYDLEKKETEGCQLTTGT
ncbi:hypothetical protein ACFFMN_19250 [Planobispora siamensis]|uniref:Uncharacterized protein n=1 Tax=Planobispora siamensis TaxID=936338 RepID=A0A8J3SRY6_9ACTN|nr:hypothetical protein [Planobispora siamensis]GIH94573.1 hypothetical protein Psi01_52030 [Planobispora siamensis]